MRSLLANDARMRILVTGSPQECGEAALRHASLGKSTPMHSGLACSSCVSGVDQRKTPCTDNVCLRVVTAEQVPGQLRHALAEEK